MTTKIDLDELERVAREAVREHEDWHRADDLIEDRAIHGDDAEHIAANSPPVTLALIARIRELEGALDEALTIWNRHDEWDYQKSDRDRFTAILEQGAVLP